MGAQVHFSADEVKSAGFDVVVFVTGQRHDEETGELLYEQHGIAIKTPEKEYFAHLRYYFGPAESMGPAWVDCKFDDQKILEFLERENIEHRLS